MSEHDDFDVTGLRVLVTGSSRGLGEEIARYLAGRGAQVAVHGRDDQRLKEVRDAIVSAGGRAEIVRGDARDPDAVHAFVDSAAKALGGLDGLINNAGGSFGAASTELSANGFNAVVAANLTAPFLVAQAALPFLERARGSIVNIGSVTAMRPAPTFVHYAAAKAGLVALTRSLAAEWSPRGVRVNAVLPGLMETDAALDMLFGGDANKMAESEQKIGVGRLGTPKDLAMACRYLLSPAAAFVNGETLVLDGGPPNVPSF
jgi:NAD(P)-dependent dehydrogenase (short-subunit alcohol dehydrogenase family)